MLKFLCLQYATLACTRLAVGDRVETGRPVLSPPYRRPRAWYRLMQRIVAYGIKVRYLDTNSSLSYHYGDIQMLLIDLPAIIA